MQPLAWLTTERDWPWRDEDLLGWPGLAAGAALLVLLTLWTYSGSARSAGASCSPSSAFAWPPWA